MQPAAPARAPSALLAELAALVDAQGRRLVDACTFHELVGRSCSTNVYVVRDAQGLKACKLTRCAPRMRWSRVVATYQREAILLQRCLHPNIVDYHGLYLGQTEAALVLGLAPRGDCQQLLMRHGPLPELTACSIIDQLCAALECMHDVHRVLHRDVKLENILVCDTKTTSGTPHIKLCDFGHSCLMDGPLHGAAVDDGFRGTEGYAAPEVAAGGPWTPAADVWGVGVVFYALLANELLRWKAPGIPEVSTKTSRAFSQVSVSTKMSIKSILLPEHERSTLHSLQRSLQKQEAAPFGAVASGGLRRSGLASSRAYSYMDLSSMDKVSAIEPMAMTQESDSSVDPASTPQQGLTPVTKRKFQDPSSQRQPENDVSFPSAFGPSEPPGAGIPFALGPSEQSGVGIPFTLGPSEPAGAGIPFALGPSEPAGAGIPFAPGPSDRAGAGIPFVLGPTEPTGAGVPFLLGPSEPPSGLPLHYGYRTASIP